MKERELAWDVAAARCLALVVALRRHGVDVEIVWPAGAGPAAGGEVSFESQAGGVSQVGPMCDRLSWGRW